MNINYDKIADAVYVYVSKAKVAKTIKIEDKLNIDVDSSGSLVGIELLDASSQQDLVKNLERDVNNGASISINSVTPITA